MTLSLSHFVFKCTNPFLFLHLCFFRSFMHFVLRHLYFGIWDTLDELHHLTWHNRTFSLLNDPPPLYYRARAAVSYLRSLPPAPFSHCLSLTTPNPWLPQVRILYFPAWDTLIEFHHTVFLLTSLLISPVHALLFFDHLLPFHGHKFFSSTSGTPLTSCTASTMTRNMPPPLRGHTLGL